MTPLQAAKKSNDTKGYFPEKQGERLHWFHAEGFVS